MTTEESPTLLIDPKKMLEKIRRHALYLLARRDHTRQELWQKLSRKDYPKPDIDSVLTRLEEAELINSARFAENYTHYRRRKGYGPKRIIMELQAKGVDEAVIAEHVEITDNAWFAELSTIWHKQFKGRLPADQKNYGRQMRFLYNRGFTQDQINKLFKQIKLTDDDDDP